LKIPNLLLIYLFKIVIFYSYVSLPEGNPHTFPPNFPSSTIRNSKKESLPGGPRPSAIQPATQRSRLMSSSGQGPMANLSKDWFKGKSMGNHKLSN